MLAYIQDKIINEVKKNVLATKFTAIAVVS